MGSTDKTSGRFAGRREDPRLLAGQGRYVADFVTPDTHFAGFLRSDQASARIDAIDTSGARGMPGVLAVFTAQDLAKDGVGPLTHVPMPRHPGATPGEYPEPVLCDTRIRHLGEPVALVVADTRAALVDALDAIVLELSATPPPQGVAFERHFGDADAARAAMELACHRHRLAMEVPRITAAALEPRGAIARPDATGGLQYRASTQNPFALRNQIAAHLGWQADRLQVVAADVGGSFGLKGYMTREDAALAWAARRLGVEVAWLPSRSETMLADAQGRGVTGALEIGLDADLKIRAIEARFEIDAGAYPGRRSFGLMNNINGLTGMYVIPHLSVEVTGTLSARAPLAPFRGNGRPEATYAIERALDLIARQIGVDPVELRRRNLIAPGSMPARTGLGTLIDCGDFPRVMAAALAQNAGSGDRRRAAQMRGKLYGVGLANCIESAGGPLRGPTPDFARLTVSDRGRVAVAPGVMSVGQGHETAFCELAAARLEIDPDRIDYRHGDTQAITSGRGSGGSAGLTVAGSALWLALDQLLDEGRGIAAARMGCDKDQIGYRDGGFQRIGSNEGLTLGDIAAGRPGGAWQVETSFTPPAVTFPNGTHICEVEIDPDTGETRIMRYVAVEDVGRVLNPVLVEGQLQGGIAQGLSLGLGERMVFDEAGQILTGTLMDYQLVRAADLPMIDIGSVEVPTQVNPLGAKGVGEAGAVGATAALASAVGDALHRAGVTGFELPATPARVWQALQRARGG
ncbi:MAG: xanthine dehydrogenase family protein molybdopterin-binding subunit [Rhodobacter sp.]|nr:xanthine dehydrogenase family protein molybdopterin-binding subunit [Rhodobacter sp.]